MAHDVSERHESSKTTGPSVRDSQSCMDEDRAFEELARAILSRDLDAYDPLRSMPVAVREDLLLLIPDILARNKIDETDNGSHGISPEDFYRKAVQREDIRRILTALAQ